MTQCIAEPISRKNIRENAWLIRCFEGSQDEMFFDIVHFLEVTLYKIDSTFNFKVMPMNVMGECHGLTFPDRNEIQISPAV